LFPGRPAEPGLASWVRESPKPPANRITLTRAVLATASSHVVVALGESKRPALVRLLAGDASLPAVGLRGLIVFTDLDVSEVGR
jgi:6-phosphogluconolactonase